MLPVHPQSQTSPHFSPSQTWLLPCLEPVYFLLSQVITVIIQLAPSLNSGHGLVGEEQPEVFRSVVVDTMAIVNSAHQTVKRTHANGDIVYCTSGTPAHHKEMLFICKMRVVANRRSRWNRKPASVISGFEIVEINCFEILNKTLSKPKV